MSRPIDGDRLKKNIKNHCAMPVWCVALVWNEIDEQPTIEQYGTWIPVTKTKPPAWNIDPEMEKECTENWPEYIVTIKGAKAATVLRYDFQEDTWFDTDGMIYPVIAWMPLPEEYKEKR